VATVSLRLRGGRTGEGEIRYSIYMKTILHLCADTGSDSKPFQLAGYNVVLVGSEIGVENYTPPNDVYGIFANPVCTEFSTARTEGKARDPEAGMFLVRECQRIIEQANPTFWVIENPAKGVLKDYLGVPQYSYEPWWYGSPWSKRTSLWGNFNIPARIYNNWADVPKLNLPTYQGRQKPSLAKLHKSHYKLIPEFQTLPVPQSDMEFRSICSQKFAQAFFKVNNVGDN